MRRLLRLLRQELVFLVEAVADSGSDRGLWIGWLAGRDRTLSTRRLL